MTETTTTTTTTTTPAEYATWDPFTQAEYVRAYALRLTYHTNARHTLGLSKVTYSASRIETYARAEALRSALHYSQTGEILFPTPRVGE